MRKNFRLNVAKREELRLLRNRVIATKHHAEFEYRSTLTFLPEGKTFESPDKTMNCLSFWISRTAASR